ncbi:hypothetical protein [Stieleria varia]|uniref:Uncharacterized protein n=1 Tax=Stieleria varia TaxID=2528005 RepID=A0A5C5ZPL2_9BACT|nr:hypothetical protein [Stieleria varia]TWT89160.1 hypothetical protein Pla52n_68930 [Stieleria varia]
MFLDDPDFPTADSAVENAPAIRNLPFVADQRVYSLKLTSDERRSAKQYLQREQLPDQGQNLTAGLKDDRQDRWESVPDRYHLLSDLRYRHIVISICFQDIPTCGKEDAPNSIFSFLVPEVQADSGSALQ